MADTEFYKGVINKYHLRRQAKKRRQKAVVLWLAGGMVVSAVVSFTMAFENMWGNTPPITVVTTTPQLTGTTVPHGAGTSTTGSQTTTVTTTESVVSTTTTVPLGTGSADPFFRRSFIEKFWPDGAFSAGKAIGTDVYLRWSEEFSYKPGYRYPDEKNVYTMIVEHNIPRETVQRLCDEERELYERWGYSEEAIRAALLSDEEIDLLYTGTKAEIYQHFTGEYAITIGETPYPASWLATHTAEEYMAAGMTVEQVMRAREGMLLIAPYSEADMDEVRRHLWDQILIMKQQTTE